MSSLFVLYEYIDSILRNAPSEDECSFEENEIYAEMENLRSSLKKAEYD